MRPHSLTLDKRQLLLVLLVGWLARGLFAWWMPAAVGSADIRSWQEIAMLFSAGGNPYKETAALNWPPFWMQMIYLVSKVSTALQISFIQILRLFLVAFESLMVAALFGLIRQVAPGSRVLLLLLLGISLNPVAIFLICQHCNFDVVVALWVVLFVGQLVRYSRSQNQLDWLAACFFLGLGILTKTVPLVLCPMLAGGLRRVQWKTKLIGMALTFGPVTLGMSVIYVLAPEDVTSKVLGYRSATGWFGISGLLQLAGADRLVGISTFLFYLLLAAGGMWVAWVFWKRDRVAASGIVLCAALLLAVIPGLGPGYSPQYLYWSWPLLLASYSLYGTSWRRVLLVFGVVAATTCLVEYAILPSHGMFLVFILKNTNAPPTTEFVDRMNWWGSSVGQTLMRLPLFAAFLLLLATGTPLLLNDFRAGRVSPEPAAG